MAQLTEKNFLDIKDEIKDGRLSPDSIRVYLGVFMLFSGIVIGIAYAVTSTSNSVIGWENLSIFWQTIFKIQGVLFLFQLVLIFLVRGRSNWTQILLNISYVFYTYKMALDPFIMLLMFTKNDGVFEVYAPIVLGIIIFGFIVHLLLVIRAFSSLKDEKENDPRKEKKKSRKFTYIPILILLAAATSYIMRNDLLGDGENLFIMGVSSILFIAILIGAVEFVLGAYCVIRFPSFRVNPPHSTNSRHKTETKQNMK